MDQLVSGGDVPDAATEEDEVVVGPAGVRRHYAWPRAGAPGRDNEPAVREPRRYTTGPVQFALPHVCDNRALMRPCAPPPRAEHSEARPRRSPAACGGSPRAGLVSLGNGTTTQSSAATASGSGWWWVFPERGRRRGSGSRATPSSDLAPKPPLFQAAENACQSLMPGGRPKGRSRCRLRKTLRRTDGAIMGVSGVRQAAERRWATDKGLDDRTATAAQ